MLLNLKRVRIAMHQEEPLKITLKKSGVGIVTAKDITSPSQIEILNTDQHIAELTAKGASLEIEMTVERGLGYVPRDVHQKDKVDIGTIALDAVFTPVRRVNYEVENMRVGDRTDFNRLRVFLETDGTLTPRQALERSIEIMIHQLKAVIGFQETVTEEHPDIIGEVPAAEKPVDNDILKTRIETLDLSMRTQNALEEANIRTLGGLVRKKKDDMLELDGIGPKGLDEIVAILKSFNLNFKE
jgi:DNA-directed RNA polymerase subunit alpha